MGMGSPVVTTMSSPRKSLSSMRRTNKPLVEKKRRARINGCLGQLKSLILTAMKTEGTQVSRLEKADILEMTVKYLRHVQRQQASSALTSEPEVVAKFSAGYSECAAEVIRYMDSVTGVTPDVRTRLESHLVGRLQGSPVEESVTPQDAYSHLDVKPVLSHVTSSMDELSLHYQTAVELANMASTTTVTTAKDNNSTTEDHHSDCDIKPCPTKLSSTLSTGHRKELSYSSETLSIPKPTPLQPQDSVVRPKNSSPRTQLYHSNNSLLSAETSLSSHQKETHHQTSTTSTTTITTINPALLSHNDVDRKISAQNNIDYNIMAPTPPDTPPQNDINNNNNNNNKNNNNNNNNNIVNFGVRCFYAEEKDTKYNNVHQRNQEAQVASKFAENEIGGTTSIERVYGLRRDHHITKSIPDSSLADKRNFEIENQIMQMRDFEMRDLNPSFNEREIADSYRKLKSDNNNSNRYRYNNYNLSSYQQPLHIHIPESPTPTTTPSPPQLLPSHHFQEQQQQQQQCSRSVPTMQHRNIPNSVLPTILYGAGQNDVASATRFQTQPTAYPCQAIKTTDDSHQSQNTCNLDNNCSNNDSQAQIFKQSTWTASEHAQNGQFQGHPSEQLSQHQQQRHSRSVSSSPLSPPVLMREDLQQPTRAHDLSTNNAERVAAGEAKEHHHNIHNPSSLLPRCTSSRRDSCDSDRMYVSSRRLVFDEEERHGDNNTNNNNNNNTELLSEQQRHYRLREQNFHHRHENDMEEDELSEHEEDLDFENRILTRSPPSPPPPHPQYYHHHPSSYPHPPPHSQHYYQFAGEEHSHRYHHHHHHPSHSDHQRMIRTRDQENKRDDINDNDRFSSSFTSTSTAIAHLPLPHSQLGAVTEDGHYHHHHYQQHRSSSSSSSSSSSDPSSCSSSPPTIVQSRYSQCVPHPRGMRSYHDTTTASTTNHPGASGRHHPGSGTGCIGSGMNMNGPATLSPPRDLSRQNVSPLSPSALKRVMMGQGLEVSARPHCTDARPADDTCGSAQIQKSGRIYGQTRVKGHHHSAISGRVPRSTRFDESIESTVAMEEDERVQTTRMATSECTEERLWRPW